jgi:magnesium-transporting ATPase (P-type)
MAKTWHAMSNNEVLAELKSSESGITQEEAIIRLEQIGPNKLPAAKPPTLLQIFLGNF